MMNEKSCFGTCDYGEVCKKCHLKFACSVETQRRLKEVYGARRFLKDE